MATAGVFAFAMCVANAQQVAPGDVDGALMSDAMAQTAGSFDTMNLSYLSSLGMQQKAWNDPMQHMGEGQIKPGYSRYIWSPDVVLPLRLREGMMTLINLPTWELIEKVHIGSPESFGGEIAAPNSLLLYADPTFLGVDSNLIIFGRSGNRYVFYLRSETYNTDRITNAVVDVIVGPKYTPASAGGASNLSGGASVNMGSMGGVGYAGGSGAPGWSGAGSLTPGGSQSPNPGLNTATNGPKNWLESIPVDPEKFRFDIDVFIPNPSDIELAPERVWRDEIFTYIDFGKKALTMTQRPVVNLIVQDSEVPVGSRTKGEHSRLLVVEGIGDMVLRNGQRIVCLKMRRDPATGLDNTDYSWSDQNNWYAPQPSNQSDEMGYGAGNGMGMMGADGMDMYGQGGNPYMVQGMAPIPEGVRQSASASQGIVDVMSNMPCDSEKSKLPTADVDNIAIELGQGSDVVTLENMWENIRSKNQNLLKGYNPYYSIDTAAEGGVPELFRLRVGPMKDIKTGDEICAKLSKKGISCSVIRTQ
ncbi:MAG: TrbG/VirB9 family P-type conjugative transfer protein [Alphaproteobacteria bacterium]|nr:TrbG/VirB9 family P-type conjugative transfer protein [Alphaproteobacteria bacterium]